MKSRWLNRRMAVLPALAWLTLAMACSNAPKRVNYSATTSPNEIIQTMEADIQQAYEGQVDVLARKDFAAARAELGDAKEQIREGRSQDRVLRKLGQARAYLDRAKSKADNRRTRLEGILNARKAALAAGAREYPRTREELGRIDDDVRDEADESRLSPEEFSRLQSRYLDLELRAIRNAHLADARARIDGAKQKNAARFTPRTLNRAELDLRNAENVIAAHRHEPEAFQSAVEKVNASTTLLADVTQKVRAGKAVLPEDVALKLVFQERGLANMNKRVQSLEMQTEQSTEMLSAGTQEIKRAREIQELERAMAEARREFSRDEAEVYRDGSKLLIRLKAIRFPIGRADLPPAALPLLAKVRNVTEDLNPMLVVVEGHTDSTGSAKVNAPLSQKRAEAVAQYLAGAGIDPDKIQAVGYSFKKPIANNKTKEGRAQNRRVDVVITPEGVDTATTSM